MANEVHTPEEPIGNAVEERKTPDVGAGETIAKSSDTEQKRANELPTKSDEPSITATEENVTEEQQCSSPSEENKQATELSSATTEKLKPKRQKPQAPQQLQTVPAPPQKDEKGSQTESSEQPEEISDSTSKTLPEDQKQPEHTADTTSSTIDEQQTIADLPTHLLSRADLLDHEQQQSAAEAISTPTEKPIAEEARPEVYDVPTVRISLAEAISAAQNLQPLESKPATSDPAAQSESKQAEEQPVEQRALVPTTDQQLEKTDGDRKETAIERFKGIVTGKLPALPRMVQSTAGRMPDSLQRVEHKASSLLKHVKRFILGEQQHHTAAAALIETPMRIQPTQSYTIRIHIMGRDTQPDEEDAAGLSALVQGDIVHIEVRSALYQNYAYIVQQADIALPAAGYAAEVTMPMRPLAKGPSSRRERLHIFFMDAERNPLYEKPFVIEIFISPLVQSGREGHNVLSIPL